ncbi:hypothetical protein QJS83_16070 [Bdellovibrio sp. 22V]|uniref:hypothetical protein n=1 Tax=Bdellovibrio TaxID=958 RepID=UPI00254335DC|nr:hypothetical protein [Bdellovibrio sp. 22V]WII71980.1 hypothetical protein QJS83_16070 [Bdellovibrio sp. 22V]
MMKSANIFWPKIESREQANGLINTAAGFCAFIAVLNLALSFAYKYEVFTLPIGKDAWYNTVVYAPLAYFIYDKSKIATWLGLGVYLIDRVLTLQYQTGGGAFLSVVITCAFISALRAFKYLESNPPENVQFPEQKKAG